MRRGRTRHQSGWITDGSRSGSYQLHWNEYILGEDGKERRVHRSEMIECKRKYMAQERLDEIVSKLNPGGATKRDGTVTLAAFIDARWLPIASTRWRIGSTDRQRKFLVRLIKDKWGDTALQELDKIGIQIWLNELAKKYSHSVVVQTKALINSICEEAVDQDYIVKNPAGKLLMPITKQTDQTVLDWETYRAVLARIPKERDRLAVQVAAACGARPGELFAFRWRSLKREDDGWVLEVEETVCRSDIRPYAKTEGSRTTFAVPDGLAAELLAYKTISPRPGDDDFIFSNRNGEWLSSEYFFDAVFPPIVKELGLRQVNFRIMRRTFATHAQKWGSTTSISRQLRHSKTATTTNHYIKPLDAEVHSMVNSVYEEMMGEAKGRIQ